MAVRTRDEIMTQLQTLIGEDTSDETLAFIEDISDTLGNDNSQTIADLQRKNEELDASWRKKYRDAFFSGKPDESFDEDEQPAKPKRFEDLFTFN